MLEDDDGQADIPQGLQATSDQKEIVIVKCCDPYLGYPVS